MSGVDPGAAGAGPHAAASTMGDDDLGRFAKALLADLDAVTTYEARILTLGRALRHLEAGGAAAPWRATTFGDLPGFDDLAAELRRPAAAEGADAAADPAPRAPPDAKEWAHFGPATAPGWSELARRDVADLIAASPGPVTAFCRRLASVAASAHAACQRGAPAKAAPMLLVLGAVLDLQRPPRDASRRVDALDLCTLFCHTGGVAAQRGMVLLATALARRAAADLGAIARAAASLEGRPECDPPDEDIGHDSIRGVGPESARASALHLRASLLRAQAPAAAPVLPAAPPPPRRGRRRADRPEGAP